MKSEKLIKMRLDDMINGIGHDMDPQVVNATRVAYVQALNWVLDNPINEEMLDAMWHEYAGITQREVE